jgi:acyl CoA:acetate/3-ketoacid CoA transferase beta subunit
MAHTTRDGEARLVEACSYPLTAMGVVDRVYTDLAVVEITADGFLVREMLDGLSREELEAKTDAPLRYAEDCGVLSAPVL